MSRLVYAEFLKFRTTRSGIGLLIAALALVAVGTAGTVGPAPSDRLGTNQLSRDVLSNATLAALVVFLAGIVCVTSEWRHGTVARTLLVTPKRTRVLIGKELWIALLAAALAVVSLGLVVALAATWLSIDGSPSLPLGSEEARLAGRLVLAAVLWGALGVGFGSLVQSQTFAVVGSIVWILVVEHLVAALLGLVDAGGAADYLPGQALTALGGEQRPVDLGERRGRVRVGGRARHRRSRASLPPGHRLRATLAGHGRAGTKRGGARPPDRVSRVRRERCRAP